MAHKSRWKKERLQKRLETYSRERETCVGSVTKEGQTRLRHYNHRVAGTKRNRGAEIKILNGFDGVPMLKRHHF